MIECIFTLDYEIYGNGEGSLKECIYEPAEKLKTIFDQAGAKLVVFVEAMELKKISSFQADPIIEEVEDQLQEFYHQGHEIALHIHPQWGQARWQMGKWLLDYSEYNLCTLSRRRIAEIIEESISYLRQVTGKPDYTPLSFRAGNWLFQPTRETARILSEKGVRIDSSVFKGGVQRQHQLDYRPAAGNGYYWKFEEDVNIVENQGGMLEIPIYTQMVPFWKMATAKRLSLQQKSHSKRPEFRERVDRWLDRIRFRQPLKFDFCRMTKGELVSIIEQIMREDQISPNDYKPIVAIGHTKDLEDFQTVGSFLSFLRKKGIAISTFQEIYPKIIHRINTSGKKDWK
ncbi:MAG: hypothetical protein AB1585_16910 [Thermodesulfobacteriota bacterium]